MGADKGNAARGLCGEDTTRPRAPEQPDIGATWTDRPMLPQQRWRAGGQAGGQPRAGKLAAAAGARRGLEDDMRVGMRWRAHRLVGNVHAPHGGNPAPHGLAAVDGLAPTGIEGCPDADLLEHAEGRRRRHGRAPQRVRFTGVVQGEGGCAWGTPGTGTTRGVGGRCTRAPRYTAGSCGHCRSHSLRLHRPTAGHPRHRARR